MPNAISIIELDDDQLIAHARHVLEQRLKYRADRAEHGLESPDAVRNLLRLRFSEREHEVFAVLFLDNRHRLIEIEEMFRGTIDGAQVHAREVVKAALRHNAAAVVLTHNHPSGVSEPSQADKAITNRLKDALALVDVRVLDHFVVGDSIVSFAESGLL